MRVLFADIPEAIDNTLVIAQRCAFMPDTRDPILPAYPQLEGRSEGQALRELAEEGLHKRLEEHVYDGETDDAKRKEIAAPYMERFDFELGVINQMGYPGYFPIVADFIQWARRHDIPVGPGRLGAVCGCLSADHYGSRSVAVGLAFRTLPQSGTRDDAGLRYRLLSGRPR